MVSTCTLYEMYLLLMFLSDNVYHTKCLNTLLDYSYVYIHRYIYTYTHCFVDVYLCECYYNSYFVKLFSVKYIFCYRPVFNFKYWQLISLPGHKCRNFCLYFRSPIIFWLKQSFPTSRDGVNIHVKVNILFRQNVTVYLTNTSKRIWYWNVQYKWIYQYTYDHIQRI